MSERGGRAARQGAGVEEWTATSKVWEVANDYSKGLTKVFKEVYPTGGGQIVSEETFRAGDNAHKALSRVDTIRGIGRVELMQPMRLAPAGAATAPMRRMRATLAVGLSGSGARSGARRAERTHRSLRGRRARNPRVA